jgi:hypothetical protein
VHRPDLITLPRVFRSSRLPSKGEYWFTVFWVRQKLTLSRGLGCSCWVNTLSAKADSFFEHPAYWRGCAQLARSRPGTLKNVPGGILISIHHKAAFASVNAFSQRLGNVVAARGADLARVVREHLFYFTTSLCNFVCEYGDEARPCDVGNRSGKSFMPHRTRVDSSTFGLEGYEGILSLRVAFPRNRTHTPTGNCNEGRASREPHQSNGHGQRARKRHVQDHRFYKSRNALPGSRPIARTPLALSHRHAVSCSVVWSHDKSGTVPGRKLFSFALNSGSDA